MAKSKTSQALDRIYTELGSRVYSSLGHTFGEAMMVNKDVKKKLVANLGNIVFTPEINKAHGESSIATNHGINHLLHKELIENLKTELEDRGKSLLGSGEAFAVQNNPVGTPIVGQQGATWGSFLPNTSQLMLLALAPSVILPVYNKVFKSLTLQGMYLDRTQDVPYVRTASGEQVNFYAVLNDINLMEKITKDTGQPTIRIEVELSNKTNSIKYKNLLEVYNREGAIKDPEHFIPLTLASDFIARGVKIVGASVQGSDSKIKSHEGELWASSGLPPQNSQISDEVAAISFPLVSKNGKDEKIEVVGSLKANGDLYLNTSSDNLKSLTFEFFIPAKGAQRPVQIIPRKTLQRYYIRKQVVGETSLNPKLIADSTFILNKDLVELFTENSVQFVGSKLDAFAVTRIDDQINVSAKIAALGDDRLFNGAAANEDYVFAYRDVNMENEMYGYTSRKIGHTDVLAQRMTEVMYDIDIAKNPNQKKFSILSDALAARWLTQNGESIQKFDIVGETLDEVAGMSLPYSVKAVTVSGVYSASYIVTNKLKPDATPATIKNTVDKEVKTTTNRHRYYINARFEENLDSNVIVHGFEKTYQTVNDPLYSKDFSLSYEKHFDMFTYNKIIGALDFTETAGSKNRLNISYDK